MIWNRRGASSRIDVPTVCTYFAQLGDQICEPVGSGTVHCMSGQGKVGQEKYLEEIPQISSGGRSVTFWVVLDQKLLGVSCVKAYARIVSTTPSAVSRVVVGPGNAFIIMLQITACY